jgi:integrase/recombinase XerD
MDDRIGQFLHFMSVEKGATENTVVAYRNDLVQFHTFLSTLNLNGLDTNWKRVKKDAILSFIRDLKSRQYAETTVARKLAAVKSFFNFLHAEGTITANPTESLESPRVGRSLPRPLTVQQMNKLLEQPSKRKTPEALRDRAMMELLYATGLRNTELVSLDLNCISVEGPNPRVVCRGARGRERTIPIDEQALRALVIYLNEGRSQLVKGEKERALFVNQRGERLTRQGFWLILKHYASQAQISQHVTPNTLRHTFATHMLKGGAPLRNVQELLGHANISTTQTYLGQPRAR